MSDSDLHKRLASLPPEKRNLLLKQLRARQQSAPQPASALPTLEPQPRGDGPLPMSFAQQRLWFMDQLEPGTALYNIPSALRLRGPLNTTALERAFTELVRRHESLRTTFQSHQEQPTQVVSPPAPFTLTRVDLGARPAAERETEARRLIQEEVLRPFDLSRGPLLRTTLLRLSDTEHVLVLVMHHIISDGWSMSVLVQEMAALYAAFSQGQPSPLPALPVQYADYTLWQRQWLQGEELQRQLSWWKQQFQDMPGLLQLPTDRPRPPAQTFRGASVSFELPRELAAAVNALCQREGVTPYMLLLSAWQVLLHRVSGQEDLTVGSPFAGRRFVETEGLIGFFVNTLVLRARLSPQLSFRELLARTRTSLLEAQTRQDLPFEKLVEELHPERDLSHGPLFQVSFALEQPRPQSLGTQGLTLSPLEIESHVAKADLALLMVQSPEALLGSLEFNTDLFDKSTASRLVGNLRMLLEGICAQPAAPLSELPLLTAPERQWLLAKEGPAPRELPQPTLVHHLFEAQARRAPDAVAVRSGGEALTYGELDARANQLAHHLRGLGVGPDVRVAICLERAPELIVAILATLKAGGAWLPMDPSLPTDRISFMLADAAVPIIITTESVADELPSRGEQLVLMDVDAPLLAGQPRTPPTVELADGHLAYVIYTSGSTGRPKGTLLHHRGLVNTALLTIDAMGLRPGERVLQFFSAAFDASVWEIVPPLLAGAELCLASRDELMPGTPLVTVLREQAITAATLTPSVLAQLEPEGLETLKTVVTAGEACTPELVARWQPGRRFINAYGPTETTICATLTDAVDARRITIGRPFHNVRVAVLDEHLRPVPVGVAGELCIGGAGVARGYLGRPELTAERFVPDAGGAPGGRLYRTGDKARWLADGQLEFLGRIDFQVKVRGYRIEPGEVEAVLLGHPALREAVVVARESASGNTRLVAYVVPREGQSVEASALRTWLKGKLPEYMVPSAFISLEALPISSSGKVDRDALPEPGAEHQPASANHVAPRTPVETALAGMWMELLELERVGAHDNFFELGGHSLLATQVISRIRARFGVELPLRTLFSAPTLEGLAAQVEAALGDASASTQAPAPRRAERTGSIPLSFAQQRLWFLDQLEPGTSHYNVPAGLRLEGALDTRALQLAFDELLRRHESLRTTFRAEQGEPVQVIAPPVSLPLEVVDLREVPATELEAETRHLVAQEARRPFNLSTGPLLRATLLRLGEQRHVLLLTLHHIISDGWSMGVLVREMGALYEAFRQGRPSPLPELGLQYADYAIWQRQWLSGEVLESRLGWWRQRLEGAPTVVDLPTDRPRPAVRTYRGATHLTLLPRSLADALEALSKREGATLFMTLMAAFQALLHRYSGQTDILVGTDVANRDHAETESLIGFFVNQLVMRLRLGDNPSFRQLLAQTRQVSLDAFAHQDVPFEDLVRALNPERSMAHAPLFQVKLVLQNQNTSRAVVELPGLRLESDAVDPATAKLDLTVLVSPATEGLYCAWMYSMDLFDAPTMERMALHFQRVLEAVVATGGEQRLSALPLLSEAERHRLLVDWNEPAAPAPSRCFHELFAEQAARVPDAVAVVASDGQLTYGELDRKANQLAHYLQALGVMPETRVGLFVERSVHALVGLLGILKAGGAYVALDPSQTHAQERMRHVLSNAKAQLIVTQESLMDELPAQGGFLVSLDAEDGLLEAQPEEAPTSRVGSGNLAYVLYTSGSTGQPKGVCIEHRHLTCYVEGVTRRLELAPGSSFGSVSTLAADLGHTAIFPTLASGGALHLVEQETAADPGRMRDYGARHAVDGLKIVPTHLGALLSAPGAEKLLPRQRLVLGGDMSDWALVEQVHALSPTCEVFNHYGPTETTVGVLCGRVERGVRAPGALSVPLGRPLGRVRVYVLDAYGQPVPVGVPGELYIGGASVARGYLGRADLTAERFVPDAFSPEPGARVYRSGDKVRWLQDGRIEFLGRMDHQLKIRGYRVELGEVEAALGAHPSVRECVVVAREEQPGDKRLVAYVVAREGQSLEEEVLTGFLEKRLPEYMVPSVFVMLEALPLTSNGKVDRKALPAPVRAREDADHVAPRTATELRLAAIWEELLKVPRVGARDDFFELGGHSLMATQVVARVHGTFGVELAVIDLFEAPTLEGLAARIDAGAPSQSALVPLRRGGSRTPFFCVHPVGGGVLCYLELSRRLPPEQPFYGLQVPVGQEPHGTLEAMAGHYVDAIQEVQPHGPYLLGGWSLGGRVAYEMARQLQERGEKVALLVIIDARSREDGPPLEEAEARAREVFQFAEHLSRQAGLNPEAAELLGQVDAGELKALLEDAPGADAGLPPKALAELRELWRVFSRNLRATQAYLPGNYPGRAVLLRAAEGPREGLEEDLGWGALTSGVEVHEVPGDHFSLIAPPHVERLAERLRELLERAAGPGSSLSTAA
ncbi:amino acid adenylation domain-containing protein [Pyxidicoccus parkwayensis]|uniref:Amino acid adenylation domain-containing protein n=1 Tax=Pyxidicoccus parkwayensis TaxID=2813578 RepID=A0ABX7NXW5_9BACT|nr:non-ribosomal peptide synthetase [Pyxidicoccus parkwaysis]QSQ23762.1 amino acid adenylation domain-containing protein [Pyxidicoccus parkwaysis]